MISTEHIEASQERLSPDLAITALTPAAVAFLLLTAAISLFWSHYKLLWGDEPYEMWTDSVSSLGRLIEVQTHWPISLDPLVYHILAHGSLKLFGNTAMALRVPALLGVLLMQVCLFFFVRRIASQTAATLALALPALTVVLNYSMEGRPYGLVLGWFALAMLSWQTATLRETRRTPALVTLALAIMLAINTHYFGILLLAPLAVAEFARLLQRRRLDLPMLLAIAAGASGILFAIPFMKAAREFRAPYGMVALKPTVIGWPYLWILSYHSIMYQAKRFDRLIFALVMLIVAASLWALFRSMRTKPVKSVAPSMVFLIALSALPVFGYIAAYVATPVLEPRFLLGMVIGMAALVALGLSSLVPSTRAQTLLLLGLFAVIGVTGVAHAMLQRASARQTLALLRLGPRTKAALDRSPDHTLYIQDMVAFGQASFYEPDPEIRSHIALLYSFAEEQRLLNVNVIALSAVHIAQITHLPIATYEEVSAQPGEHVIVDLSKAEGWNWIGQAFADEHVQVQPLEPAFGNGKVIGEVVSATFPHPTP